MSCFLTNSSVGKKLVMSVTGCFLVLFILFHMSMNLTVLFSREAYNMVCEFLGANWYALAATVVLAGGVAVHFLYAFILTFNNYRARGKQRYAVTVQEKGVSWASKNMLVLGIIVVLVLLFTSYTSGQRCSLLRFFTHSSLWVLTLMVLRLHSILQTVHCSWHSPSLSGTT